MTRETHSHKNGICHIFLLDGGLTTGCLRDFSSGTLGPLPCEEDPFTRLGGSSIMSSLFVSSIVSISTGFASSVPAVAFFLAFFSLSYIVNRKTATNDQENVKPTHHNQRENEDLSPSTKIA